MGQKIIRLFLVFAFPLTYTLALLAPQIYLTEINLSKENFLPGENIEGEVTLWNYENFAFGDLVLHFYLLGEEVEGVPTQVIDSKKDTKVFSLFAGEKKTIKFVYSLPENLPKGALKFRVRVANQKGEEMTWIDKVVNIGGEGEFLVLENYWILKNGEKLAPGGGVDFNPNEIPQVIFDVKNETPFNLAGFIKITTYKRKEGGEMVSEERKENIVLNSQETKTVKTTLSSLSKPDTYLSKVQILNEKNQPISNPIYFRWIVRGENDAEVLFIQSQKSSFKKDEIAKIKVQFTGPAHEKEVPDKGILKVKILNERGEVVGEGEKVIDLKSSEEIVEVYVKKDVENPKIVTEILKENEILDKYEIAFKEEEEEAPQEKEIPKTSFWKENQPIIILSAIILVVLIAIILWSSFQKGNLILKILFFLIANFLFIRVSFGAVEVADSPCKTTIYFNTPFPNQEFKVGDIVRFSGGFEVTSCGNGLFFNKIEFFITEDKEIPIKNANCCSNCCGASSSTYSCSSMSRCEQVKILDTSNPEFKVYKLGTIYPPDVHTGAKPYEVQFDKYFTIPSDLGFSGNVRFYVQYSGTHWKSHWHWNITYQPGKINSPPEARNLKVIQPDCCLTIYPKAIFKWDFFDQDYGEGQSAFRIQVDDNEDFSSPEIDTGKINDMANEYHLPGFLSFNKKYWWRIKVWDTKGNESTTWAKSATYFETPKHAYPQVDFSWFPTNPSLNEEASFFDKTKFAEGVGGKAWFWQFENGIPSTSSEQNPKVRFQNRGENQVTLRVTDADDLTCQKTKIVFVPYPLPKWREALPAASIFKIIKDLFR